MRTHWNEKRYYSLDYYLKETFGHKLYKLALNGNMTCPNRDGVLGTKGCIFCSSGGSGEFASNGSLSIPEQIVQAQTLVQDKYKGNHFIAYFQAYTNTYAPVGYLNDLFSQAISHPDIEVLSIATRPDCLGDDVLDLLASLNSKKPVWVELGLQTIHEATARRIRRGYALPCFLRAVKRLRERGLQIIVHVILGLPQETEEMILETIDLVSALPVNGIKLQLLHVLKDTDLAFDYAQNLYCPLTLESYVELVIACLEHLSQSIVIHRLTGDGPKKLLLAPAWSADKKLVLNTIQKELKQRDTWQGRYVMNRV